MSIRSLFVCFLIALILSTSYALITRIAFKNQRGHISSLYCSLLGKDQVLSKPVIFLPGIKGSLLNQDGHPAWLTLSQIVHSSAPFIYHPQDIIEPVGILTRLALIPGLIEYAPYQQIAARLACDPQAYFFSYDWRRNPLENATLFDQLVDRVTQETGQKPSIIAHSMGGLVTHGYLKTHSQKVDRIVYVGVPFKPGVGFLPDLNEGSATGLNKTILNKEAIFSHPSSFTLLPHQGSTFYKNKDLMDVATWKDQKLSIFRDSVVNQTTFEQTLNEAKSFHHLLDTPVPLQNRFLFVIGNCHQTLRTIEADDSSTYGPGDGRVLEESAYPVEKDQLNKEVLISCATHDQQLNDKDVLARIIQFLK